MLGSTTLYCAQRGCRVRAGTVGAGIGRSRPEPRVSRWPMWDHVDKKATCDAHLLTEWPPHGTRRDFALAKLRRQSYWNPGWLQGPWMASQADGRVTALGQLAWLLRPGRSVAGRDEAGAAASPNSGSSSSAPPWIESSNSGSSSVPGVPGSSCVGRSAAGGR